MDGVCITEGPSKRELNMTQTQHLRDRMKERFGLVLPRNAHAALLKLIREYKFSARQDMNGGRVRYRLIYKGHKMWVVLDKKINCIITAWPALEAPEGRG